MNQIGQYIDKGTLVRIRTTNGGDSVVKLLEEYRPSYSLWVESRGYAAGHAYFMDWSRIKSIEIVNTLEQLPLTAQEMAKVQDHLAFRNAH